MERDQMLRIAAEVMSFYGSVRPWSSQELMARQSKHFAGYLPDKVLKAVATYAADHPDRPPRPADLLAWMRRDQTPQNGLTDPDRCSHPRPLAIVAEDDDGGRIGLCPRCHTEIVFPPGRLLTETEIEDQKRAKQEARHG